MGRARARPGTPGGARAVRRGGRGAGVGAPGHPGGRPSRAALTRCSASGPLVLQIDPSKKVLYASTIMSGTGPLGADPSYVVLAADRLDQPLVGTTPDEAWQAAVERVRAADPGAFAPGARVSGAGLYGLTDPGEG